MPVLKHVRLGLLLGMLTTSGCYVVYRVGLPLYYDAVSLPAIQTVRDLPYRETGGAASPKQRLNLFVPTGSGWPVVIFVHGGGWDSGDRNERLGGHDYYNNIGRYLAAHGIGTAVVSYRLLPQVTWPEQVDDVAAATAWVHQHIGEYGGDPAALFLMGYSAGGQLATRVALDPHARERHGLPATAVCGVIPVSGVGFDMTDQLTYKQGPEDDGGLEYDYLRIRFAAGSRDDRWAVAASPIQFVRAGGPPFLILYAEGEQRLFHRQAAVLDSTLRAASVSSRVIVVPARSHARMVLALSRDDQTAGPAIRTFVETTRCPSP